MLKKIFQLLDFFLPSQISDQVDIATIFRARSIVAAGLVGIITVSLWFLGASFLGASLFVRIGLLSSLVALVTLIIFLKTRNKDFERSLNIGAFIQIILLYVLVYASAFSLKGMGFFGLIWLVPLFLITAFYFKPIFGIFLFCLNIAVIFTFYDYYQTAFFNIDKQFKKAKFP